MAPKESIRAMNSRFVYARRQKKLMYTKKNTDMSYLERYIAEEIGKYGPIPVEKPETRTPEEMEQMRKAVFAALDRRS